MERNMGDRVNPTPEAQAQGGGEVDPLLTTAVRNLRSYLSKASFSSVVDKRAAENCVEVLASAATTPPSAPVEVEQLANWMINNLLNESQLSVVPPGHQKALRYLAHQPPAAPVSGDARELLAQQLRKDGHATAARVVRQGEENALLTSAIKLIAALAQQPAANRETEFATPDCPRCGCVDDGMCLCQPAAVDGEGAEALRFLLTRIGSWTDSRWDQHLRHEFGDERAAPMIAALNTMLESDK